MLDETKSRVIKYEEKLGELYDNGIRIEIYRKRILKIASKCRYNRDRKTGRNKRQTWERKLKIDVWS